MQKKKQQNGNRKTHQNQPQNQNNKPSKIRIPKRKQQKSQKSKNQPSNSNTSPKTMVSPWHSVVKSRNYHERNYLDPLEQSIPIFYTTHSIFAMLIAVLPCLFYSIIYPCTMENWVERATYICLYLYFVIAMMCFPSGPFIRPHPVFWRVIFGCSILYMFAVLILLIAPVNLTQKELIPLFLFDWKKEILGKPIILPDYASDCRLTWLNISSKMDRFVFAHFVGWFFKALLIRNRILLWSMSLIWELIELSTVYYIPNFGECWWDSWILDFLICNGLGIEIGMLLCNYWMLHSEYHWSPFIMSDTICKKIKSFFKGILIMFFTPAKWKKTEWELSKNNKRFFQVHIAMIVLTFIDINAFLLKLYLWIPTNHWFNIFRVTLFWFMGFPAVRQYYFYVTDDNIKRMGSQLWMLLLIVMLETALVYKTQPQDMPNAPMKNKVCWVIATLGYLGFSYAMCITLIKTKKKKNRGKMKIVN